MRISKEIRNRIKEDNVFSLKLALELDKTQANIRAIAKTNAKNNILTKNKALDFYEQNGYDINHVII